MTQPFTSPLLTEIPSVAHGFFGREGGVSGGIYASLNCGYGSGDDREAVRENRGRVTKFLGADTDQLCTAYQIHSPRVALLETPWAWDKAPEADAMVTRAPGVALGILTADCVPVLLADREQRVIGAAHAGWRGAAGGIIEATIQAMSVLGARPEAIAAAIGPCIAQASYEVGPEFIVRFLQERPEHSRFFTPSARAGHQLFNLRGYVQQKLEEAGVSAVNCLANDTCFEENAFFSYRRATLRGEPAYGRQVSAIMLKDE